MPIVRWAAPCGQEETTSRPACTHAVTSAVPATFLNRCRGGIIYLPGQAGTVQEIFQALTGNYYATSEDEMTPLIMLGNRYWSQTLPAWPLLHSMSRDHPHRIRLVDTVDEAVAALRRHPSR